MCARPFFLCGRKHQCAPCTLLLLLLVLLHCTLDRDQICFILFSHVLCSLLSRALSTSSCAHSTHPWQRSKALKWPIVSSSSTKTRFVDPPPNNKLRSQAHVLSFLKCDVYCLGSLGGATNTAGKGERKGMNTHDKVKHSHIHIRAAPSFFSGLFFTM